MKENIINYFAKISIKEWIILLISFLAPIHSVIIGVFFLIILDLYLGIRKSIKQNKKITSRGLFATGKKIYTYNMIIISAFLIDHYLVGEFIKVFIEIPYVFTKLIAIGSVWTELVSIHENVEILYGVNILDRVMKTVKGFFAIKKDFDKYQE